MKLPIQLVFSLIPALCLGLPTRADIIQGEVSTEQLQSHLDIYTNEKAVIHWGEFSIHIDESVEFHQPDAQSITINKVLERVPSQILGSLLANGKIVLVNPSGIIIGQNANIETGSFIASTLNLHEKALENQEWFFSGESKEKVINNGTIKTNAGDTVLIGYCVENHGTIEANEGASSLLATQSVLLKSSDSEHIYMKPKIVSESQLIDHGGFGSLLDASQKEDALIPVVENGETYLVLDRPKATVNGSISSQFENEGGVIHVLGDHVDIQNAHLDVSHDADGGKIFIGGDYGGKNPDLFNASRTSISPKSFIDASSKKEGNGGRIIIWADEGTWCSGLIKAEGGKAQGDGGFVEISGKNYLEYHGNTSTFAFNGKTGTLLFDPINLLVSALATNAMTTTIPAAVPFSSAFPNAVGANLSVTDLAMSLGSNNVTLSTVGTIGPEGGVISFASPLTWSTDNSLTALAEQTVTVGTVITNNFIGTPSNDPIINFQGNLGNTSTAASHGVTVPGTITSRDGSIFLTGNGGPGNAARGVLIFGTVEAVPLAGMGGNGNITLVGAGDTTGGGFGDKEGVRVNGRVEVTNGLLSITGDGGNGTKSQGLELNGGGIVRSSGSGNIQIVARGGPGNNATGLVLGTACLLECTGTGSMNIQGFGEGTGFGSIGVERFPDVGPTSFIRTTSGNLTIFAQGSPNGSTGCHGINLDLGGAGGGVISSTSGNIDITAIGGGNTVSDGVRVRGVPSMIATTSGLVTIRSTGGGGAGGNNNHGIHLLTGGTIDSQAGTVFATGIGGVGDDSFGVLVETVTAAITSTTGDITVTGIANATTLNGMHIDTGNITSITGNILARTFSDLTITDGTITSGGYVTVTSVNDIFMNAIAADAIIESTGLGTTVVADRNIAMVSTLPNTSQILANADVAVVVDNAFPVRPLIGPGYIDKDFDSIIASTGGGRVRIFTARQSLNNIQGNINGTLFTPGPLFVNSTTERWATYFFDSFGGVPFTVFYKDPTTIQAQEQAFAALEEIFRFLHPYDEFIRSMLRFKISYEERHDYAHNVNSFDRFDEFDYAIRRHYVKDWQVKLPIENKDL